MRKLKPLFLLLATIFTIYWFCDRSLAQSSPKLATEQTTNKLELVASIENPMPTGITVSQQGRIFTNFPRWGDKVDYTVAEIQNGRVVAYPDAKINVANLERPSESFISVQSVVVDSQDRLWILDTGSIEFGPTTYGGPKLVGVDLQSNKIFKTILFPQEVALPTTYLNDIRFDLRRGKEGVAFITDSSQNGPNGIIVVDLETGRSWRRLNDHPSTKAEDAKTFLPVVEGEILLSRPPNQPPSPIKIGADGIAINNDGSRLFYCSLASRKLYSVSIDALVNEQMSDDLVAKTVFDHGDKGGGADGLESDAQNRIYLTNYEHNAILRRLPDGSQETVAHSPNLLWPDTLSVASDGYLYVTANQLHRQPNYHGGKDLRQRPYSIFRLPIDAGPVRLR
jgi:sugar lactone lactonase YvrE